MRYLVPIIMLFAVLSGCSTSKNNSNGLSASSLSDAEYAQLSAEEKYAVISKLTSTIYQAVPVDEFFDLTAGLAEPQLLTNSNHLSTLKSALSTPVENFSFYIDHVLEKHFDQEWRLRNTRAIPMATLYELPLGEEYFQRWMAYILTNTIMFSPAYELDSTDHTDVESIYNDHLVSNMANGESIANIVYHYMISEENWRRFRSPEDNTREMMEIFLQRFDDTEVPLASIACQNWYLTDDAEGYQLRKGANINTEAQSLLDRDDIVSCEDFYSAIANHSQLIPTVTARLVNLFFSGFSLSDRASLTNSIVSRHPTHFKDIFSAILFSKEYLLNVERTKTYEEALFGTAHRIDWYASQNFYHNLNDDNPGDSPSDLQEIRQATMSYKLGRGNEVPLDSLAVAYYHKSIRDQLLLDRRTSTDPASTGDGGWKSSFIDPDNGLVEFLNDEDFIRYLILSVLGRNATANEIVSLRAIIVDNGHENSRINQTLIVLDYCSRLSEFYALAKIGMEE